MKIYRAKTAGFCMGVDLALQKLDSALNQNTEPLYMLGAIIHNPQVLDTYFKKGVLLAKKGDNINSPATAIVRAHGIPQDIEKKLLEENITIIDATCPKVKKAQNAIAQHSTKENTLLLYGEKEHPEVLGLLSYSYNSIVFENLQELQSMLIEKKSQYFLAAQTTQDKEHYNDIIEHLQAILPYKLTILDTICHATQRRQLEAVEIAKKTDFCIIVGGKESANTRRLVSVIENIGTPAIHIESIENIPLDLLKQYKVIGLTAGASTPKYLIDKIEAFLTAF